MPPDARNAAREPQKRQKQGNGKAAPSTADHGGTHPKGNRGHDGKPMPSTAGSTASRPDSPDTMPRATLTGTPHGSPTRLQKHGSGQNSRWQWRRRAREIAADGFSQPEMINYTARHPKRQQAANMTATGAHTDTEGAAQTSDNRPATTDPQQRSIDNRPATGNHRQETADEKRPTTADRQQNSDNRAETRNDRQQSIDRKAETTDRRRETSIDKSTTGNQPQETPSTAPMHGTATGAHTDTETLKSPHNLHIRIYSANFAIPKIRAARRLQC